MDPAQQNARKTHKKKKRRKSGEKSSGLAQALAGIRKVKRRHPPTSNGTVIEEPSPAVRRERGSGESEVLAAGASSAEREVPTPSEAKLGHADGHSSGVKKQKRRDEGATGPRGEEGDPQEDRAALEEWLGSPRAQAAWAAGLKLGGALGAREEPGLLRVRNVLPPAVARGFHDLMHGMPDEYWEADEDYGDGVGAEHRFMAVAPSDDAGVRRGMASPSKLERTVAQMYNAVGSLVEGQRYTFQLARYTAGHFIEMHDDTAQLVLPDPLPARRRRAPTTPPSTRYTRDIAVILYLAKGWREAFGGCLVDHHHEAPQTIVPEFNSMVAFRVPRQHQVTAVKCKNRPRYSLFGWFLSSEPYPKKQKHKQKTKQHIKSQKQDSSKKSQVEKRKSKVTS